MSLNIVEETITAVLLSDGNWYRVGPGTFTTDAYEFVDDEDPRLCTGVHQPQCEPVGATFIDMDGGGRIDVRLDLIMATRRSPKCP
jgi:hypothetical protein